MNRKLIMTKDGSHSISIDGMNATYHSVFGAIQESMHVFVRAGFIKVLEQPAVPDDVRIFEVGFGTGLNALCTLIANEGTDLTVNYEAIDPFPLDSDLVKTLNYCKVFQRPDLQLPFEQMHSSEEETVIAERFNFRKSNVDLRYFRSHEKKHLVYFDAFAPDVQPELWTKEIFDQMFSLLAPGGILVTYSSKGSVRRAMQAAGFIVEKLPGPPGKKQITRAIKKLSPPAALF